MEDLSSRVSAERVNGLSIVEKMTRGTMQLAGFEVEAEAAGGGMLVASAGAELTNLARAMSEAKTVLVCIITSKYILYIYFCFLQEGFSKIGIFDRRISFALK